MAKPTKWKREGDGWRLGPYAVVVIGETSGGRPCRWGLQRDGVAVKTAPVRGRRYDETFERARDAKWRAERLLRQDVK